MYYSHLPTGRPYSAEAPNKYTSHYFDEANGPLYAFGYGLSYTTFAVSDVKLSSPTMKRNGSITASVTITNTGKRAGETVAQLYLHDVVASVSRPVKELRGFQKVMLMPGESRTVTFTLSPKDLMFYNAQMQQVAEPGKFDVMIGLDSQRVKTSSFTLL
jgi:beta-glucosidase